MNVMELIEQYQVINDIAPYS